MIHVSNATKSISGSVTPRQVISTPIRSRSIKNDKDKKKRGDESGPVRKDIEPIRKYSLYGINDAVGIERDRIHFWNSYVNTYFSGAIMYRYTKTEIYGIIDTAWTLKKSTLLMIETERIENKLKRGLNDPPTAGAQLKTIRANADKLGFAEIGLKMPIKTYKILKAK